jgi:hypothetical protein
MAKSNDKKVVKQARDLLVVTLGNFFGSHRERRFPGTRKKFCSDKKLQVSAVTFIETGRLLSLDFAKLRIYLAHTHGRDNSKFTASVKKVYDGLKELDDVLKML